jgi:hypothetical protein
MDERRKLHMDRPENIALTDVEWQKLSEEEQSALVEDESDDPAKLDSEKQHAELAAGADEVITDDETTTDADKKTPAAEEKTAVPAKAEGEGEAAAEEEAPDRADFVPQLNVPTERNFDEEEAALVKKYEDGEIPEAEYRKGLREIYVAQSASVNATSFNEQVRRQVWEARVAEFVETREHYKPGSIMYAALDRALGILGPQADKEGWSDMKLLTQADKAVRSEFGVKPGAEAKEEPKKEAPKAPPRKTEAQAREKAPMTLNEIPAAELPDTGNDRFAALDKLADSDSSAYERELARLSPEEQNAYLIGR